MRQELLPARGKFYKANLHMHTTISDGELTPEEVKRVFSDHGYSIVAFTDHEIIVPHNDLTDEQFWRLQDLKPPSISPIHRPGILIS